MEDNPSPQFALDNLITKPRTGIDPHVWDTFAERSPSAWLYHTYDMQDAIATWPRKNDLSFALVDEEKSGEIVATIPLHRIDRPFLKIFPNCHIESMGGIACHPQFSEKQRIKVADKAMEVIKKIAEDHRAEEIRMYISPLTPYLRSMDNLRVNPLIELGLENTLSQTYLIDLHQSKEIIWSNMEGYCRTHIRKAEKKGYSIRKATSLDDLDIYYELHCQTYHRTNVKPHPYTYFEAIWNNFVSNNRAVVFFAELDGKVLAADNEAVYKKGVSGWTAAGEGKATCGVNNLLHWTAIQWAINNGMEVYESGEGFPGESGGKRKGLTDFKKSFGGELFPLYRGRIIRRPVIHHLRGLLQSMGQ